MKVNTIMSPNQTLKIAQSEAQPIRQKSTLEVAGIEDIIFKT